MLNEDDLSRADLNLLVLFETVLGERHVGRAADRLSLSPSAVSHGLKRLRRLLRIRCSCVRRKASCRPPERWSWPGRWRRRWRISGGSWRAPTRSIQ
jgi:hypothetical protein